MKKLNVKKNYFWSLLYTVSSVLIPLITTPFLARTLGAEAIGTNGYVSSVVSYFLIFCVLGTSVYGQRRIAYYSDNPEERSRAFYEVLLLRISTTVVSLLVYSVFYFYVFKADKDIFLIYFITFVNVIVDIGWYFQGMENFKSISIRNFIVRIVHTIFIFIVIRSPDQLWIYVLSSALCTVLGNALLWVTVSKSLVKVDKIRPFKNWKDVLMLFLPTIASQAYVLLDKSMIQWITNDKVQVGCYEESDKMVRLAMTLIESTSIVMLSKISNLFQTRELDKINGYFYRAIGFACFLAFPMMFGLVAVTNDLVLVFFGEEFVYAYKLLPMLSLIIPLSSLGYLIGFSYLVPIGKQRVYTLFVTIASIVNVGLNVAFIFWLGSVGAAVGSVIGELLLITLELIYCSKKRLFSVRTAFAKSWKYLLASAIMFGIVFPISFFLLNGQVWTLLVNIGIGVATYALILFLLRDEFYLQTAKTVLRKIFRKKTKEGSEAYGNEKEQQ